MTTAIIVHIAPDEADPTCCGTCKGPNGRGCGWAIRRRYPTGLRVWERGPECHRREKLLADLLRAREEFMDHIRLRRLDAAIDAIKEETP